MGGTDIFEKGSAINFASMRGMDVNGSDQVEGVIGQKEFLKSQLEFRDICDTVCKPTLG